MSISNMTGKRINDFRVKLFDQFKITNFFQEMF